MRRDLSVRLLQLVLGFAITYGVLIMASEVWTGDADQVGGRLQASYEPALQ